MNRRGKASHQEHREARVADDRCPECGRELDTGYECNDCGYDATNELPQVFTNCNVCGRKLHGNHEHSMGMCDGCGGR